LRQIEVAIANGKTTSLACKEAGIVEQTYFRWRKEYGGLQVDQAKRLKELDAIFPALVYFRFRARPSLGVGA
jgi:hypothetical protein